jgi:hypothetical protein
MAQALDLMAVDERSPMFPMGLWVPAVVSVSGIEGVVKEREGTRKGPKWGIKRIG